MSDVQDNSVTIVFEPNSKKEVDQMAKELGTDTRGVITQALSIFRLIQGKTVHLLSPKAKLEIKTYANKPPLVD